jgi:protein involved in polysaccharide export with SLBB domain
VPIENDVKRCGLILIVLIALVGCGPIPKRESASPVVTSAVPTAYAIAMPDVLEVRFIDHAQLDCLASVDVDGTIDLGEYGRPVVERCTIEEARQRIASSVGVSIAKVTVKLRQARSQFITLSGPDRQRMRLVPYAGPETVAEFLNRLEIPVSSEMTYVVVLRGNVAGGGAAEVHRVDLQSTTSTEKLTLQAGDAVYLNDPGPGWWARHKPNWIASVVEWFGQRQSNLPQ